MMQVYMVSTIVGTPDQVFLTYEDCARYMRAVGFDHLNVKQVDVLDASDTDALIEELIG